MIFSIYYMLNILLTKVCDLITFTFNIYIPWTYFSEKDSLLIASTVFISYVSPLI